MAVIGSNMVLAEMCSDVEGSNRMMLPWSFADSDQPKVFIEACRVLTESNVSIAHEACCSHILIRGETCNLSTTENVPDNRSPSFVEADCQSP